MRRHGEAVDLGDGVKRITAPNPSPMTRDGTETYLVGREGAAVIDPGPDDPGHLAAIRAAAPEIGAILVTHSHRDHSAGAARLAAETGAPVLAFGPHGAGMSEAMMGLAAEGGIGGGEGADEGFRPDRTLGDGETVEGPGWRIAALWTPGHLSNHLAFALEGTGILFTGDVAMGWSTTLVSPPEGDMAQYMATLGRLMARAKTMDRRYLPGHGDPVEDPADLLSRHRAHRLARRDAVLAALGDGPATAAELVPRVYRDVDPAMHGMAERNLLATLLWQRDEGAVRAEGPVSRAVRFRLA